MSLRQFSNSEQQQRPHSAGTSVNMGGYWSRVSLRKFLSSCITSLSVRRKDSQGCTADVKDTPSSPEEKMTTGSIESIDSGVSLKSDQSKAEQRNFEESLSLGRTFLPQRRNTLWQMMKIWSGLQTTSKKGRR